MMRPDYKKVAQVVNYLTHKEGGKIDKLKLVKLAYLADRYHLRKYGRTITGDFYFAMGKGPVGSTVKDIAEFSEWLSADQKEYIGKYLALDGNLGNTLVSIDGVDTAAFSKTDVEALDYTYENFGANQPLDLVEITHKYPEWERFKPELDSGVARVQMDYEDFFKNPSTEPNDKFGISEEQLNAAKEIFKENSAIEKALGS